MKHSSIRSIRRIVVLFIILLALSGITAFPLQSEVIWMKAHLGWFPVYTHDWIRRVHDAVMQTPEIVLYGTDWLAFAHLVIAVFFVGVYLDPVRNRFIITAGIIACAGVFPLAFICGNLRHIPVFHQWIDCAFGLIGLIPLFYIRYKIQHMIQELKQTYGYISDELFTL